MSDTHAAGDTVLMGILTFALIESFVTYSMSLLIWKFLFTATIL